MYIQNLIDVLSQIVNITYCFNAREYSIGHKQLIDLILNELNSLFTSKKKTGHLASLIPHL